jgi:hypothetical protein
LPRVDTIESLMQAGTASLQRGLTGCFDRQQLEVDTFAFFLSLSAAKSL